MDITNIINDKLIFRRKTYEKEDFTYDGYVTRSDAN